jgi:hypothetical protein
MIHAALVSKHVTSGRATCKGRSTGKVLISVCMCVARASVMAPFRVTRVNVSVDVELKWEWSARSMAGQ